MDWDDDYYQPEDEPAEERRDPKIQEAKSVIKQLFKDNPREVFYVKQLQVRLEKKFYHWITGFAIRELVEERFLGAETHRVGKTTTVSAKFFSDLTIDIGGGRSRPPAE